MSLLAAVLTACAPQVPATSSTAESPSAQPQPSQPPRAAPFSPIGKPAGNQPSWLARLPAAQAEAFRIGYAALVAGDAGEAARAFERLAQQPLNGKAAAEAWLRLGEARARAGEPEKAEAALEEVLRRFPGTAQAERVPYFLGLTAREAGRTDEARQRLAEYAAQHPRVAAAIWLRVAEDEFARGQYARAAEAARDGLRSAETRGLRAALLERLGEAESRLGHPEAAFDAYRQTLALAQGKGYLGEQLFHLAQAYRGIGKQEEAARALQTALREFPSARTTADALRLLAELEGGQRGLPGLDHFELGRARFHAMDFYGAAKDLEAYLAKSPDGLDAEPARMYRALAQMALGPDPEAIHQLQRLGRQAEDAEVGAEALLEAGKALEQLFRSDQAQATYEEVLRRYGSANVAPQAAFRLGFARYLEKDYQGAIQAWEQLLQSGPEAEAKTQALYWLGKALMALGRKDDAQARWREAARVEPNTGYGLRAAAALTPTLSGGEREVSPPTPAISAAAEKDLEKWFADRRLDLNQAAAEVTGDPDYQRAVELAELGLYREGNWQAEALLTRHRERGDRLYWLGRRFQELGLYAGGLALGREALEASGVRTPLEAPAALREVAYPMAFGSAMAEVATRFELDPLLLTALVREESGFDPWAEAPGKARGLARLRPVRVEEALAAMGRGSGYEESPERGVTPSPRHDLELAGWYLADRLGRYGGRVEPMLVAYTASEGAADAWLTREGTDDPDVFLEQVPFEGTRMYVLEVLGSYGVYQGLYGRGQGSGVRGQAAEAGYDLGRALEDIRRLRRGVAPPSVLAPVELVEVPQEVRSSLGRGRELRAAGRCAEAEPLLVQASAGELGAYAYLELAACATSQGQHRQALDYLARAQDAPGPRLLRLEARERTAETYLSLEQADAALGVYRQLLADADYKPYRAQLGHNLAAIERALGRREAAVSQLRTALSEDPKGLAGQAALAQLEAMGVRDADPLQAGLIRFHEKRYREAIAYFDTALAASGDGPAATARYHRAVAVLRLGQDRQGIEELRQVAREHPSSPEAPQALFKAGRVLESLKEYRQARQVYEELAAAYPASTYAPDARFRASFAAYQAGDTQGAVEGLRGLLASGPNAEVSGQAQFWLGKALQRLGEPASARTVWQRLASAQPDSYYGLRAADLLAERAHPAVEAAKREPADLDFSEADRAEVLGWAAARGVTPDLLESDPRYRRARTLLGLGLQMEARWELQGPMNAWGQDAGRLALLAAELNRWGVYDLSLKSALRASWAGQGAPGALQKLIYPVPFPELVTQEAARQGIDPLLFSALMRQESLFDQFARSSSHARGLSQIIPPTGYEIAQRLGRSGFRTDDLFRPQVSVEFGAWYFARRVERYRGMPLPALAAYNGGPWAVDSWLLTYGDGDPDAFVEGIPFSETQPYVQRIYEFWQEYRALYGS